MMNNTKHLTDVQSQEDSRDVEIQRVGVNGVEVPLIIQRKNEENQYVNALARVSVSLPKNYRGAHMSRFIEVLATYRNKNLLGVDIKGFLTDVCRELDAKSAYVKFDFRYLIDKKAPVTDNKFPVYYPCSFEGTLDGDNYRFILGVKVPVTTLCPCSKEISDNSAHNQRTNVKLKVSYDEKDMIWIEDLIELVESCASSPVYTLLKRQDEKFVTEAAYNNPKFVEDVLRDLICLLRKDERITFFEAEVEAQESIHNHNAWAWQKEEKVKE